jgi:pilus assembly protein FimV
MQREKRMLRKLVLSIFAMLSLFSSSAYAVGLGEIKQSSGLNQPLNAEIPLLSAGDLAEYEVLASLASNQEFEKVGVERIFFLNSIKFETIRDENDQIAIKVTTRTPVKEPFLNFIVELNWPNGRILREYTLLLDPPIFEKNTASTMQQSSTTSPPRQTSNENTANAESTTPRSSYTAPESTQANFNGTSYGPVSSNDTLWSIASKVRPNNSVSIHQTLVAIYRANPDAFAQGNINNLLKGKVLNIPDQSSIQNVPKRAALQDVVMQNRQWRSGGARNISNRSGGSGADSASQSGGSRLSLATENSDGDAQGYGSDTAELNKIKQQLTRTQEQSATLQAENEALRARLAELLEKAEKTAEGALNVEDAEMAALAQNAENKQQDQVNETDNEVEDSAEDESLVDSDTDDADSSNDLSTQDDAQSEEQAGNEQESQENNELVADSSADASNQSTVEKDSPPAIFKPKAQSKGIFEQILDGGMYLYAGIGALILIVMLVFWRMKKRMEDEEFQDDLVASAGAGSMDTTESFELPDVGDDMLVELDMDDDDQLAGENADESFDPIGEADIYIAYGKHEQAESLLLDAIEENSIRADLKVKLMEVYAETENREKFESLAEEVSEAVDAQEWSIKVDELRNNTWGDAATGNSDDDFDLPSTEDIFGDDEDELDVDFGEPDSSDDSEQDFLAEQEDDNSLESLDDIGSLDDLDELDMDDGESRAADSNEEIDALDDLDDIGDFDEVELPSDSNDLSLDDEISLDIDSSEDSNSLDSTDDEDFSFDTDDSDDLSLDDDFDFEEDDDSEIDFNESMGDEGDEIATKLDLARAYVDMGDAEGAKEILKEVIAEGNEEQKAEAHALIDKST